MGQMKIRKYRPEDVPAIKKLINSILKELGLSGTVDKAKDLNHMEEYFGEGGGFWVLTDDDTIVGTIGLHKIDDEDCYFCRFYLKKEYRGKRWGSKLWHHRQDFVSKLPYKRAYSSTHHCMKEAIHFYINHGYKRAKKPRLPTQWADLYFIKKLT